jgi:hypothetical protein
MVLLGSAARNAANIILQKRHRTTVATREAAVATATAVDAATVIEEAEKAVSDKAYRAADDGEEEDT